MLLYYSPFFRVTCTQYIFEGYMQSTVLSKPQYPYW